MQARYVFVLRYEDSSRRSRLVWQFSISEALAKKIAEKFHKRWLLMTAVITGVTVGVAVAIHLIR